jgi:hypothetical protein
MADDSSDSASPTPESSAAFVRSPIIRKVVGLFALILFAAAITVVIQHADVAGQALQAIVARPRLEACAYGGLILGSIAANILLTGALFRLLISRYGRVGAMEMQALIASATLINFLPLRPGMFSRIAYHKVYHQVRISDSAKTIVQAVVLSAAIASYLALAGAVAIRWRIDLLAMALTPLALIWIAGAWVKSNRIWLWAVTLRYAEFLVIAVRYHAAFALIGSPIDVEESLAFACISVIATMIPFVGNGLGLREWAVGLTAPLLTSYQTELAITADLLIRASELLVVGLLGTAGMTWIYRHRQAELANTVNDQAIPRSPTVNSASKS